MEQVEVKKKIIAYYRVSTKKQATLEGDDKDKTGLGLEAQKETVQDFAKANGAKIIASYRDIESGRNPERPELLKAIAHARMLKATLVIAKLDRLSRNAAYTLRLLDSDVDFVCCDNPNANRLTIQILAAVAENESRVASARTKAALAQAKKKGILLGSARKDHWKGREDKRGWRKAIVQAAIVRSQKARKNYELVLPKMIEWRDKENLTLAEIAKRLNDLNYPTSTGGRFTTTTVWRLLNDNPAKAAAGKTG